MAEASAKVAPSKRQHFVQITAITAQSEPDHAKVVLVSDAKVEFSSDVVTVQAKDGPRRQLVIDLKNAVLGAAKLPPESHGLVRKVGASSGKGQVRIELALAGDCAVRVYALEGPHRVVAEAVVEKKPEARAKAQAAGKARQDRAPAAKAVAKATQRAPEKTPDRGEPASGPVIQKVSTQANPSAVVGKVEKQPPYTLPKGSMRHADTLVKQLGLTVRTIMIDPGHGGKDNGATGLKGVVEKNVNLAISKLVGEKLSGMGFDVRYTRTKDVFVPLNKRTEMANEAKADLFLSIHCNASDIRAVNGIETYSLNLARTKEAVKVAARENAVDHRKIGDLQAILTDLMLNSKIKESCDLAQAMHHGAVSGMRGRFETRDHGVHEAPFYVLMGARMPAILVEVGYVTNPEEAANLASKAYIEQIAQGLAKGVAVYKSRIERYASL